MLVNERSTESVVRSTATREVTLSRSPARKISAKSAQS
jgi:hypothetical protein